METAPTEERDGARTTGRVAIEWNWDFDDVWLKVKSIGSGDEKHTLGEEGRFRLKGRCTRCWGGLIGKRGADPQPMAIRCRVCGILLAGNDAREEYRRMEEQNASNTLSLAFGFPPKYRDSATFVQKVFPHIDRLPADEFRERAEASASKSKKAGWLTRTTFPAGSAGFLFLQARALMSGVERLPRELSVARFPDLDIHDDGSATVCVSKGELGEHSKTTEYELMKRLGSTMTIAMMSAFACELVMKAIRLTRLNDARRSHDLWLLYCDLPADSRERMEQDCPEAGSVLRDARHTFDKWRYFEARI